MGPAAYKLLSQELPLGDFPVATLPAGTVLHHFGSFHADRHQFGRPMWVSDDVRYAEGYGITAPFHTMMTLRTPIEVVDLHDARLPHLATMLHMPSHRAWTICLSAYLNKKSVRALRHLGHEIFLPNPDQVIDQVRTVSTSSFQARR